VATLKYNAAVTVNAPSQAYWKPGKWLNLSSVLLTTVNPSAQAYRKPGKWLDLSRVLLTAVKPAGRLTGGWIRV
jgi:hypothetical protein